MSNTKKISKRVCILDIETTGIDLNSKIVLIGLKDLQTNEETIYDFQLSNKELIKELFQEKINEYNILVGYNIRDFDWPIIERQLGTIHYGKKIDLYWIMKNKIKLLGKKLKNFKLGTVADTLQLEQTKGTFDYKVFQRVMTPQERKDAYKYLRGDLRTTKSLFDYLDKFFEDFKHFIGEKDISNYNHFACNTGTFVYKMLCKSMNIKEVYAQKVDNGGFTGGYVFEPRARYSEGDIYCLDFNSLYPHIMMMANLFSDGDWKGGDFNLKGTYSTKDWHPVSRKLKEIYDQRVEWKKAGDARQYVLKIIINTIYGLTGNSVFANFYDKNLASDCTRIGRYLIKMAAKEFEQAGYEILYGDTDSVYLKDVYNDENRLLNIKSKLIEKMKKMFPFPVDSFDMGVDYRIKKAVFFQKKMYMFIDAKNELKIKGLPVIKDNATGLSLKIVKQKIEPLFKESGRYLFNLKQLINWCYEFLEDDKSLIAKSFNLKDTSYYKSHTNIYYKLAKQYGEGAQLFIPNLRDGIGNQVRYTPLKDSDGISVKELSLRSVLQELSYFCSNEAELQKYINSEKLINVNQDILTKWL